MTPKQERYPSISELITEVRKFNQRGLLIAIAKHATEMFDEEGRIRVFEFSVQFGSYEVHRRAILATHSLASLTRIVLAHGSYWAKDVPTLSDIIRLDSWVRHLSPYTGNSRTSDLESIYEMLFQASYHQFPMQLHNEYIQIGRSLAVFEKIPEALANEGEESLLSISSTFDETLGMSLRQFMATGFVIAAYALQNNLMRVSEIHRFLTEELPAIWTGNPQDCPTPISLTRFLEVTSLDCAEFKKEIGDLSAGNEEIIRVETHPLPAYPIVRIGSDEIVVPIVKLLFDRISIGVFHDLANYFAGEGVDNPFRTHFGKIFERYVKAQLQQVFAVEDLIYETNYGPRGHRLTTPDWTINSNLAPVMIECRTSPFTVESRRHAEMRRIVQDLDKIGVDTLSKAPQKQKDIEDGKTPIVLKSNVRTKFALCTWESLLPVDLFGTLLADQLTSSISERFHFAVVPVAYLEMICAYRDPVVFMQAIDVLTFDARWRDPSTEGVFARLEEVLPRHLPGNPLTAELADDFLQSLESIKESQESQS